MGKNFHFEYGKVLCTIMRDHAGSIMQSWNSCCSCIFKEENTEVGVALVRWYLGCKWGWGLHNDCTIKLKCFYLLHWQIFIVTKKDVLVNGPVLIFRTLMLTYISLYLEVQGDHKVWNIGSYEGYVKIICKKAIYMLNSSLFESMQIWRFFFSRRHFSSEM